MENHPKAIANIDERGIDRVAACGREDQTNGILFAAGREGVDFRGGLPGGNRTGGAV